MVTRGDSNGNVAAVADGAPEDPNARVATHRASADPTAGISLATKRGRLSPAMDMERPALVRQYAQLTKPPSNWVATMAMRYAEVVTRAALAPAMADWAIAREGDADAASGAARPARRAAVKVAP